MGWRGGPRGSCWTAAPTKPWSKASHTPRCKPCSGSQRRLRSAGATFVRRRGLALARSRGLGESSELVVRLAPDQTAIADHERGNAGDAHLLRLRALLVDALVVFFVARSGDGGVRIETCFH